MKKIFSIASALMLALGMGMTSCSNDIDEVVTEQQPEMHKLYLSATAPNSPETRSYAEGVDGSDAIKITGWKAGDVIYGLYQTDGTAKKLAFTFNGDTHEFESGSTTVTNDQIKYFVYGDFDFSKGSISYTDDFLGVRFNGQLYFKTLTIDVANNYTNIPMWGAASVVGGKLTTNMQMAGRMAFLCLHNSSNAQIDVRIAIQTSSALYYAVADYTDFNFEFKDNSTTMNLRWLLNNNTKNNKNSATVTTIPAGKKAYLPICNTSGQQIQVFIDDNNTPFATKDRATFVAGKIYKLNYTGQ